jgi:hypothetical protein
LKKTLRMNQKIKALERHASGLEKDYSGYSLEEQKILVKADEIIKRLKQAANPHDRFGTLAATREDRTALVEAAELSVTLREKQALEVK